MELKDAVVVITGAGSGLGRALALAGHYAGAHLVLTDLRHEQLVEVATETHALAVTVDVTQRRALEGLAEMVHEKYGSIDLWINNAGVAIPHAPADTLTTEQLDHLFSVNAYGTIYGSLAAWKIMGQQHRGTILNILSIRVMEGHAGSAGYAASKGAAAAFAKSLRTETMSAGVQVLGVFPGPMKTHLFDAARPADYDRYMDPNDVARAVIQNLRQESPQVDLMVTAETLSATASGQ